MSLNIPDSVMAEVFAHCERTYPDEGCGVLVGPEQGERVSRAHPCTNIQNRLHAEDPVAHPRTARTAYRIDPADLFRITREVREEDLAFKAIYHSHADVGAYFSDEDQHQAAPSMSLSITSFAKSEGITESAARVRIAEGRLSGDPDAGTVRARMPVYPELIYLVVDVTDGTARSFESFAWDGNARTYVPCRVTVEQGAV